MHLLQDLNPEQKRAASHVNGPLLILAGAGSGKTKTITHRMANLVKNHGISAEKICGVTFTNKAAKEMRERLKKLMPRTTNLPLLCTFHSLCIKILRTTIHHLGFDPHFTIYDTSDQLSVIRQCLENYRGGKNFDRKIVQAIISKLKNYNITADNFVSSRFYDADNEYHPVVASLYPAYQKKLKLLNALDFDDLLLLCVEVLSKHPESLEVVARKFDYLLVDEYQDTNPMQFELLKLLTTYHKNICVVGDDDQSIYAFRGADVKIILNFAKHFPNTTIVSLEQNYRSNNKILSLANHMIAQNINRHPKKLWSTLESNDLPLLWSCQDDEHEALIIADDILQLRSKGTDWANICILCRSNNQFLKIEDAFKENLIPYTVLGGQKFYEKKEIKDLLGYLSFLSNPRDDIALRRIINVPSRGIGDQTLEQLNDYALKNNSTISQAIQSQMMNFRPSTQNALQIFMSLINETRISLNQHKLSTVLEDLILKIDYLNFIQATYAQQPTVAELKKNDVTSLIDSIKRFEARHNFPSSRETLYQFLEFTMQQNTPESDDESLEEKGSLVSLMTMHGSKGLEFDYVYLPGVEEDILPHKKSIDQNLDLSEERRLFYVAITRAKKRLVMSYAKEKKLYNKMQPRLKSRFLQDLEEFYLYQDRTTLGHLSEEEAQNYKKDFFQGLSKMLE